MKGTGIEMHIFGGGLDSLWCGLFDERGKGVAIGGTVIQS